MSSENEKEKTKRIGIMSMTMIVLGLSFLCSKCDCRSSDRSAADSCQDEFLQFEGYTARSCDVGATVEIINSPPAPKAGILCHCQRQDKSDAGVESKSESAK